jgi:hypothetical protein
MGLDVALGVLVLLAAVRGWYRGFILQAIRLGGIVACVYLADPVRDLVRPFAREHLATMGPELLDKLLWWAAAAVSYVVTTGVASWLVHAYRRHPYGEFDPHRGDQSAGALLGASKGLLVVAFLVAGIDGYAPDYVKAGGWAGEQVKTSRALAWSQRYQPAARIWAAPPVRMFVEYVRRMGLQDPKEPVPPGEATEAPAVQTASRPDPLTIPSRPSRLDPSDPGFNLDEALDSVRDEMSRREAGEAHGPIRHPESPPSRD